jgi:hypothetical protein
MIDGLRVPLVTIDLGLGQGGAPANPIVAFIERTAEHLHRLSGLQFDLCCRWVASAITRDTMRLIVSEGVGDRWQEYSAGQLHVLDAEIAFHLWEAQQVGYMEQRS